MKTNKTIWAILLFMLVGVATAESKNASETDEILWNTVLKNKYFGNKTMHKDGNIISLEVPYRAEDPALVPISISSGIMQTSQQYIKKISLFVDKNPYPFVGEFTFTPLSGKADLAMRIRVNTYSQVRAVAELNDGRLYMAQSFVKASGGCSAPISADFDAAMQRLGKVKFKMGKGVQFGKPTLTQLLISHPNITGMQMHQVTRFIKKPNFVEQLKVTFNEQLVMTAKLDIAISADPNFRFYFVPQKQGILKVAFNDTFCESPTSRAVCLKGSRYSARYHIKH